MAVDIMAAFTNDPQELDFIWPGFLAGTVGTLGGIRGDGEKLLGTRDAYIHRLECGRRGAAGLAPVRHGARCLSRSKTQNRH